MRRREDSLSSTQQPVLSIDVGGTKLLVALVSSDGRVLARHVEPTAASDCYGSVVSQIEHASRQLLKRSVLSDTVKVAAVSLAVAGAINVEQGVVTASPNLPQWRDVPLRDLVQESLQLRTFMLNDASAAALGEHAHGAGSGTRDMVFLTVSTGIGGGIIIGGELYQGACGGAGEIGHMVIIAGGPHCGCGNYGCLEALASGTAIAREAVDRIALGTSTSITRFAGDGRPVTAEAVAAAAEQGDPLASEIVSRAANYLGLGLVNVVNIFNPEVVVIGGGVARMGERLLGPARLVVCEKAFKLASDAVRIVQGALGADAGVVGAAMYAHQSITRGKA